MSIHATDEPATLDEPECLARLRSSSIGRLAVVLDGRPEIFPVNYVVDHGSIVFRTSAGTKLAAALDQFVAFESDGYDAARGAWSVILKGVAREVLQMHEVLDALDLPLYPWDTAPKPHIIRIDRESVSGRSFPPRAPRTQPVQARRAPPE